MLDDFTVTLIVKDGKSSTLISQELDFTVEPYEVCMQDMIFVPGSWQNIREGKNFFSVYDIVSKQPSVILDIPVKHYTTKSEFLRAINVSLIGKFTVQCDMFYYHDKDKTIFPNGEIEPGFIPAFNPQWEKTEADTFPLKSASKPVVGEKVDDKIPDRVYFGGGLKTMLAIRFCKEMAILLGIVNLQSPNVPTILNGWNIPVKDIDLTKNNLPALWVYGDFVGTTMIGPCRDSILKIVPIQSDSLSIVHSVFHMQDFIAVRNRKIQNLTIWFQETPSSRRHFKIFYDVIITLYFRVIR